VSALTAPAPLMLPNGEPARNAWTLSEQYLHVNHGSFGAVPIEVQRFQQQLRAEMEATPVKWFIELPNRIAASRAELASIFAVSEDSLAMVPNASAGASVVFGNMALAADDEIVVTNHGYGAVTMGAERLARRSGAKVVTAKIAVDADAEAAAAAVIELFSSNTRLVVIDQITSPTGLRLPITLISDAAAALGIRVLVDAAHAPGLIDKPLQGLSADYWTGNMHKFGCGPRGSAVMIARPEVSQQLYPIIDSWGAPHPYPVRFDHQGTQDLTAYLSAAKSWNFVEQTWGWSRVREYMADLADYAEQLIADSFSAITGEGHLSGAKLKVNALRLVKLPAGLVSSGEAANQLRDYCTRELGLQAAFTYHEGQGYFRLSTHAYTTAKDFEEFAERIVPALCKLANEASSSQTTKVPHGISK